MRREGKGGRRNPKGGFKGGFNELQRDFRLGFGSRPRNFGPKEMHKATCADCGNECEVPFKPTEGRPVYCRGCFQKHKKF